MRKLSYSSVILYVALITIIISSVSGCENSFDPIKESDLYNYTMYGILDLSADTQWVRVMPLRDSIVRDPVSNNATVTLTRESDGRTVQLQDSLQELPGENFVWNFWTTEPLIENEVYTVKAESKEGEVSSARAVIPPDFLEPRIEYRNRDNRCIVSIEAEAEHLVVAEINFTFDVLYRSTDSISRVENYHVSYLAELMEQFDGSRQVFVDPIPGISNVYGVPQNDVINISGDLLVVSADSNWYDVDVEAAEIPGQYSNVQNGLGLVTGIVSKKLPYRPNIPGQENFTFCPPQE